MVLRLLRVVGIIVHHSHLVLALLSVLLLRELGLLLRIYLRLWLGRTLLLDGRARDLILRSRRLLVYWKVLLGLASSRTTLLVNWCGALVKAVCRV